MVTEANKNIKATNNPIGCIASNRKLLCLDERLASGFAQETQVYVARTM